MSKPIVAVDVQDMLCAQALAVIAQALARLTTKQQLDVLLNTDDVKRDLLVWVKEGGHRARELSPGALRLEKGYRS